MATVTGLKQATAITGMSRISQANPIAPLVTDISSATDLVTNLDSYAGRVISFSTAEIDAPFTAAGSPQVAAKLLTVGLDDVDLRFRLPEAVRAQFDLQQGCLVDVDYGVMWRFNAVAQPSVVNAADISDVACDAPTVSSAIATSQTSVVVTFTRALDPATVQAADFTFNNGLTAMGVAVAGNAVTITTTAQTPAQSYTVTAATLTDVLGAAIGMPDNAMFTGYVTVAGMILNEINPNIASGRDLIELLVTSAGSTNGITVVQDGTNVETLITMPDVIVAAGDLIVVHLTPASATGAAPGSETTAKNQYPFAMYSANYDNAWDFHGGTIALTFNARIIRVEAPGGASVLDAVPFILSNAATPPAAFPLDLQALQATGGWLPADCGGALCTYVSTPTAMQISVDYLGSGNSATGNTIARKAAGLNTHQNSDWNAAAAHSWGAANP